MSANTPGDCVNTATELPELTSLLFQRVVCVEGVKKGYRGGGTHYITISMIKRLQGGA